MVAPLLWGLAACADDPASRQILAPEFAKPAETDPCEDLTLASVYPGPSSLLVTVVNATTGVPLTAADEIVVKVGHRCFGLLDAKTIDANGQATFGLQAGVKVFIGAQQIDLDAALLAIADGTNFWPNPNDNAQAFYALELADGQPRYAGAFLGYKKGEWLPFLYDYLVQVGNNPPVSVTGNITKLTIGLRPVGPCQTDEETDCVREYVFKDVATGADNALAALNPGQLGTDSCDELPWMRSPAFDVGEGCGVFSGIDVASDGTVSLYTPPSDCQLESAETVSVNGVAVPIIGSGDCQDNVAASFMACSIMPNGTSVIFSADGPDPMAPFDIGTVFLTTGVTNGSWPLPQPSQLPVYVVSGTFGEGISAAPLTVKTKTTGPGITTSNNITISINTTPDDGHGDGVVCSVSAQTGAGAFAFCVLDPNNPGVVLVNIIETNVPTTGDPPTALWTLHEVAIDGTNGEGWPNPSAAGGNPDVDLVPFVLGAQTYCPILDGGGKVGIGF